ncbi:MAG: hypothetical protein ABIH36_02120 [bacterium]
MKNSMKKISLLVVCVVGIAWGALTLQAAGEATVDLRIEGSESTVFARPVTVSDCSIADVGGVEHEMSGVAACALAKAAEQSSFEMEFKDFGFGLFLDRIGSDSTPDDFSQSWSFWTNDSPASVGVDTYEVEEGDNLLLAFSAWPAVPLRVTGPDAAEAGETITFLVEKRVGEYDDSFIWQGGWQAAENAILDVGSNEYQVPADGVVRVTLDSPGTIAVQARGEGLVRSSRHVVEVAAVVASPSAEPTVSPSPNPSPSSSNSSSPSPSVVPVSVNMRQDSAGRALVYLRGQQSSDGTIGGSMTSAWSAMAFGADYQRAQNIMKGGASLLDGLEQAVLSSATDVERQIMAVRAAGINPRSFAGSDLVMELKSYYRQGQFGEESLINDDVFGILALLAAEEPIESPEIRGAVKTVLSAQKFDGSWDNIDMTAAAVQALNVYAKRGGSIAVGGAVIRARDYLRNSQDKYGGWGENSATTAWTIQAVVALGEKVDSWKNNDGMTPWQALLRYRNNNGGFGWREKNDVSAFMTAYAVPALLGRAWPITLLELETSLATSPLPAVAGAVTAIATVAPVSSLVPEVVSEEVANVNVGDDFVAPRAVDRNFAITLFGLANLGIGVAVARMILI